MIRPGTAMSASEDDLARLPGFAREIGPARAEAKRLLAEAGQRDLKLVLTTRGDVPICWSRPGRRSA